MVPNHDGMKHALQVSKKTSPPCAFSPEVNKPADKLEPAEQVREKRRTTTDGPGGGAFVPSHTLKNISVSLLRSKVTFFGVVIERYAKERKARPGAAKGFSVCCCP